MNHSMEQVVFDFEREEGTARPQHAKYFSKRILLSSPRAEVMQHENGDCGRKSSACERQQYSVGLHDSMPICDSKPSREIVTPLEARHARSQSLQCGRTRAWSGAQFEHVVSQRIFGKDPRQ